MFIKNDKFVPEVILLQIIQGQCWTEDISQVIISSLGVT